MNEEESLKRAIGERIEIVPYDPSWPEKFKIESERLQTLLPGVFLAIEHVGSTAVPELSAKPIIDINAAVQSMAVADELLPILCANGYTTSAEFNATLTDRRWLMRHSEGRRTYHLHLVLFGGDDWKSKIKFREILRTNKVRAREYAELKQRLSQEIGSNRDAYTDAKTDFILDSLRTFA